MECSRNPQTLHDGYLAPGLLLCVVCGLLPTRKLSAVGFRCYIVWPTIFCSEHGHVGDKTEPTPPETLNCAHSVHKIAFGVNISRRRTRGGGGMRSGRGMHACHRAALAALGPRDGARRAKTLARRPLTRTRTHHTAPRGSRPSRLPHGLAHVAPDPSLLFPPPPDSHQTGAAPSAALLGGRRTRGHGRVAAWSGPACRRERAHHMQPSRARLGAQTACASETGIRPAGDGHPCVDSCRFPPAQCRRLGRRSPPLVLCEGLPGQIWNLTARL